MRAKRLLHMAYKSVEQAFFACTRVFHKTDQECLRYDRGHGIHGLERTSYLRSGVWNFLSELAAMRRGQASASNQLQNTTDRASSRSFTANWRTSRFRNRTVVKGFEVRKRPLRGD